MLNFTTTKNSYKIILKKCPNLTAVAPLSDYIEIINYYSSITR